MHVRCQIFWADVVRSVSMELRVLSGAQLISEAAVFTCTHRYQPASAANYLVCIYLRQKPFCALERTTLSDEHHIGLALTHPPGTDPGAVPLYSPSHPCVAAQW